MKAYLTAKDAETGSDWLAKTDWTATVEAHPQPYETYVKITIKLVKGAQNDTAWNLRGVIMTGIEDWLCQAGCSGRGA